MDGYIANTTLFEQYGIALPTNYGEFVEVCRRFEEMGISGYLNDYNQDYSCMEALQGCAIPQLMTMNGTVWRAEYESETEGAPVGLDTVVWPTVFEKYEQYLRDTFVAPEDSEMDIRTVVSEFVGGRAAIMRGTASDCVVLKREYGMDTAMLPYFGETAEDNWLLTYPACQVAVNREVEGDAKKQDAVMRVLNAIFSEEGQRKAAASNAVLSYNKSVHIELNDSLTQVEDCVRRNHLYIRLASTEMFSVSKYVVQKMIRGEYGAEGAYEEFHTKLMESKNAVTPDIITTQNVGYDYSFGKHGNPAASAVVNTLCKHTGCEIAIGYSNLVTTSVFAGTYTEQQVKWLVSNRAKISLGNLTGAEIMQIMRWLIEVKEDGSNPVRHGNLIPVTAGIEYTVTEQDGRYTLKTVTVNGAPLDEDAVYSVMLLGDDNYIEAPIYCNCPMPEELKNKTEVVGNAPSVLYDALNGGNQVEAPTEYVTVRH